MQGSDEDSQSPFIHSHDESPECSTSSSSGEEQEAVQSPHQLEERHERLMLYDRQVVEASFAIADLTGKFYGNFDPQFTASHAYESSDELEAREIENWVKFRCQASIRRVENGLQPHVKFVPASWHTVVINFPKCCQRLAAPYYDVFRFVLSHLRKDGVRDWTGQLLVAGHLTEWEIKVVLLSYFREFAHSVSAPTLRAFALFHCHNAIWFSTFSQLRALHPLWLGEIFCQIRRP